MKPPFISVIIPVFNAENTIDENMESLMNQKYPKKKYEIVVVDNGSSDNTLRIIKKYRNVSKILKEKKRNSYCARNKGILNAKGSIIAFIDSDCIADHEWLFHLSKAFTDTKVKIVGGKIRAFGTNSILLKYCDKFCHHQSLFFRSKMPFFAAANMSIRKKCLVQSGLFLTSLKSGGDVELCSRMVTNKKEICYEPKAIVSHIYKNSFMEFLRKHYYYGKWHKFRKENLGINNTIPRLSSARIFTSYGVCFLFLRILQIASYKYGLYFGRI